MKLFFNTFKSSVFLLLFYAVIAAALLAPLSSENTVPAITDYANHIASVIEAKMAFAEGQFPLRIAPTALSGWRYPNFQFYSPSTYTFAGFIYQWLTPANPITAVKWTIWFALIIGGVFMQRLAYWFVKSKPAAVLASVVYLTAPYYVVVITGFGNLCEAVALGIVPAVIYYSLQYYLHPKKNKVLVQTSFAWYLLITTHMITFIYTALFTAILLVFITCKNKRHWKNLMSAGIGLAFGCLLAMWFLAPIVLLQKYLIIAQTFTSASHFQSFHPAISNLFFPGHLDFQGPLGGNHVAIGWPILIGIGLCTYAFLNQSRLANVRANYWLLPLLILFFLVFIIVWSPISFLQWAPSVLLVGQYCWRLLDQLIWIGALLFAWAICWLFKNKLDLRHIVVGTLLLIVTASATFPTLFKSYFNIDLAHFIKKPAITFNPDAYTIQFNKYTGFVDNIDTMLLYSLMTNHTLQLNKIYSIPKTLIHYAKKPKIEMDGTVPNTLLPHSQLIALLNDSTIATLNLKPGKFHWIVPFKSETLSKIHFKTNRKINPITIKQLVLSGFLPEPETLNVKTVQSFCQQQKTLTVCKINVPKETKLIELPILYYPALLRITLNGKITPYKGIVYKNNLIVGITPIAGANNQITVKFTGLIWANMVSLLSWIVWIGLLVFVIASEAHYYPVNQYRH
jgi:hypothetical protein